MLVRSILKVVDVGVARPGQLPLERDDDRAVREGLEALRDARELRDRLAAIGGRWFVLERRRLAAARKSASPTIRPSRCP